MTTGADILDLGVIYISKLYSYSFIKFLTHKNMCLETKIKSLACLLIMLRPIYQYRLMAAKAAILDLWDTTISKLNFYNFIEFLTPEIMGLDSKIE